VTFVATLLVRLLYNVHLRLCYCIVWLSISVLC